MKIQHSVRYDAPVADVYAMLTDPAFREKATTAQVVTKLDVSVVAGSVTIDTVRPNTDVPAFAKAVAGESTHSVQAEQWTDGTTAAFSVKMPGKPGHISGTRRLISDGQATLDTFDGEAKVSIPLVGGKIEKLIADKLTSSWNIEHSVGTQWLEGDR
ncbi:DUF2505 domain-containing protein [Nocardioides jensenii]|uniref:DUF2505 domain-containing protein n=1 Tax=Nocardioides jensenii TaxID=1843 RepID=UPI000834459B|nr:DUF2505 domain-containing protein [Nocardioides jensenii]